MKRKKLIQTIAIALGLVSVSAVSPIINQTGGIFTQQEVRADDTRPMFDASGYVTVNGIKYHKTGDTTVGVAHGEDYDTLTINIPAQISVNDVRFDVTSLENNAFLGDGLTNAWKPYSATKINLPKSISRIGTSCFFSLINIEILDLSNLTNLDQNVDTSIISNSKLSRVKLPSIYYYYYYGSYNPKVNYAGANIGNGDDASKLAVFENEATEVLSQWALDPQRTRVNELQDAPIKDGYTFTGWKIQSTNVSSVRYTIYTPQYVQGQPIWDFEDKVNALLAETPVSESTTQEDMQKVVDTCKTYDNINYTISNFRVVPSQWNVRGAVRFTINTTNVTDNSTSTLDIDRYTTALPATGDVNNYLSTYSVTEATTQEDAITYLSKKLNDVGLGVSVNNFNNNGKIVSGTVVVKNKLTGENQTTKFSRAIETKAQSIVTDTLNSARINSSTTPDDLNKYLSNVLGDGYKIDTSTLTNKDGKVVGDVIVTTPSGGTLTIPVTETIPTRTETAADANTAITSSVPNLNITTSTTAQDIIDQVNKTIKDPSIVVTVPQFTNKDGKITGNIVVTDVDTKETKTIPISIETESSKVVDTTSSVPVSAKTTESDILNAIIKNIDPSTKVDLKDYVNDGTKITGTVVTTDKNGNTITTPITIPIVSQSTSDVLTVVKKNMMNLPITPTTTEQDIYDTITKGIKDADVVVLVDNFSNDGKTITGDITISKPGETDKVIKLSKTISGSSTTPGTSTDPNGNNTTPGGETTTPASSSTSTITGTNTNTTGDSNSKSSMDSNTISGGNASMSGNTITGGASNSTIGNITVSGSNVDSKTGDNSITVNPSIGSTTITSGNVNINTGSKDK